MILPYPILAKCMNKLMYLVRRKAKDFQASLRHICCYDSKLYGLVCCFSHSNTELHNVAKMNENNENYNITSVSTLNKINKGD